MVVFGLDKDHLGQTFWVGIVHYHGGQAYCLPIIYMGGHILTLFAYICQHG